RQRGGGHKINLPDRQEPPDPASPQLIRGPKQSPFARAGQLDLAGFRNSGADWLERFKPYIEDGRTVVASPHKVFGPETNDLVLQLRKRKIQGIILGGMLANMCVESHMCHLIEEGFEVAVVRDATAGPRHPVWGDGYQAAMINYRFFAHALLSTDELVDLMH
ncbi:isochorismatase family protein, partial [Streptomyces sp. AK02-04a]|uniref:isochorismatase family protein n=1 Tax=Streptomyces sp. AK02-04a TaxID=3028649 RepID=UPI0029A83CE9